MSERYLPEELVAIHRYENKEKLNFSTDISDQISYGYGMLDYNGFFEFPLPYSSLNEKHKSLVDEINNRSKQS